MRHQRSDDKRRRASLIAAPSITIARRRSARDDDGPRSASMSAQADMRRNLLRRLYGCMGLTAIAFHSTTAYAQPSAPETAMQACGRACRQQKLDSLFRALDEAEASHPKPSDTADCAAYDGHDYRDVFLDVCAKVKYVRSLPPEGTSRFICPRSDQALVGYSASRIASAWGTPDLVRSKSTTGGPSNDGQWIYFMGRSKPGWVGGGFAEMTLYVVDGTVRKVDCGLAK